MVAPIASSMCGSERQARLYINFQVSNIHVLVSATLVLKDYHLVSGHAGSVNECVFHPKEPIIASGSSDKQIYLGEIDAS